MRVYHIKVVESVEFSDVMLANSATEKGFTHKCCGEKELERALLVPMGKKMACVKITDRKGEVIEDKDTKHPVLDVINDYLLFCMRPQKGMKITELKDKKEAKLKAVVRAAREAAQGKTKPKQEAKAVNKETVEEALNTTDSEVLELSTDLHWKKAIEKLDGMSEEQKEKFLEGEKRESVLKAAKGE